MAEALSWFHHLDNGRLECEVCPRHCRLKDGQRGFCFARQRQGERIVDTTSCTSLGFQIDPVEKKPLNHFFPGSQALSFGTAGCNLGCTFCQNWHMSRAREVEASSAPVKPQAIAQAAKRYGCQSVAFTYNDPIIWAEYAIEVAKACRALGVKTVAVSNGFMSPGSRRCFYEFMDGANIDLKAFTEGFYRRYCLASLRPVLDTLVYIRTHTKTWLELTTLIIPGLNDSPQEMAAQCRWIVSNLGAEVPLHLTAFHPTFRLTDRESTPLATLLRLREVALEQGLKFVYTGNVMSPETQSTYCPHCGELLLERRWHRVEVKALRMGCCGHCGAEIPGVW